MREMSEREKELRERLAELKRQKYILVDMIRREAHKSLGDSYDFAMPHLNVFAQIIQIEAGIRELEYIVNTLGE